MRSLSLQDMPYAGNTSRPGTSLPIGPAVCKRCGSSRAGRREAWRWSVIRGVRYVVDVYRSGCGRGRHMRRPV